MTGYGSWVQPHPWSQLATRRLSAVQASLGPTAPPARGLAGLTNASGVGGNGVNTMERLAGREVVTGATSGIGKAMAQALLEAGMEVVVAARASARLEGLVAAWRAAGLPARQGRRRNPQPHHDRGSTAIRDLGHQVLPGGATATGMIPDRAASARLLDPAIMGPPAVFLASGEAGGLTGQRIVAKDFGAWLGAFRSRRQGI